MLLGKYFAVALSWIFLAAPMRQSFILANQVPEAETKTKQSSARIESTDTERGLRYTLGQRGLTSLSYNGQSLLPSPQSGELRPWKQIFLTDALLSNEPSPVAILFRAVTDALLSNEPSPAATLNNESSPVATLNKQTDTIDLTYPWGHVSFAYHRKGDNGIAVQIQVANASEESIENLSFRLMELNFPSIPQGTTLEAGMFGYGFKGTTHPLDEYPLLADSEFVVPLIRVDYATGTINFCSDDFDCSVGVPASTNLPAATSYPFVVTCHDVKPGITRTFNVSLRFGPSGSSVRDLSDDVLKRYATKYPFQVRWNDHRPIGAIYLASSGIDVATNPRRWILNSGKTDVTTDQGKATFRAALLKLADESVKVLKDAGAQGMITWDPEGQEFLGATYYGDPRLTPTLAPETDFKGHGATGAMNDYFEKFRAAGLKVGVCIRPQQITMVNGKPKQGPADDEHAVQVLKDKIAYAKQQWGCTIFYVDSTYTGLRPLNPDVFKAVAEAYPDVLLIPENESMRYFAYSAPLNSYVQHRVTSTPVGARLVYPKAFSVLIAPDGDRPEDHDALVAAIRNGDILLFNGGYMHESVVKIRKIYAEAALRQTDSTLGRGR
jgi:hypothetical protein